METEFSVVYAPVYQGQLKGREKETVNRWKDLTGKELEGQFNEDNFFVIKERKEVSEMMVEVHVKDGAVVSVSTVEAGSTKVLAEGTEYTVVDDGAVGEVKETVSAEAAEETAEEAA